MYCRERPSATVAGDKTHATFIRQGMRRENGKWFSFLSSFWLAVLDSLSSLHEGSATG